MYSLNAAIPAAVIEQRDVLRPHLEGFDQLRDPLTFVIKRFGTRDHSDLNHLERSIGRLLEQWGPMAARIDGIGVFVDPPGGPAPVVYFDVTSHGVESLHRELVDVFGLADTAIEGDNFIPHITLARGGPRVAIDPVTDLSFESITWSIDEVLLWSARHDEPVTTYSLPYRS